MRRASIAVTLAAVLGSAPAPGADRAQVSGQTGTSEALAIIVHRSNPVDGLTRGELRRIFLLETQTWPHGRKITVVLREKGQPERAEAIRLVCGMTEAEFDRYLLFQTFRGNAAWGPRSIQTASAMQRFVFNAPGAIGDVDASELDGSTKVLRIDGLLPSDPGYALRRPRSRTPNPEL